MQTAPILNRLLKKTQQFDGRAIAAVLPNRSHLDFPKDPRAANH